MIYVVAGDIGSGKTLFALSMMRDAVAAGRPVFTDIQLTDACPFGDKVFQIGTPEWPVACESPEEGQKYRFFWEYCHKVKGALIILDEADIEFDSADFGWFGRNCKIYNKQVRKFKHDVVYIVQRPSNLYKRIRDLAGRFIACEHNYRSLRIMRRIELVFGREFALGISRFLKAEYADPSWSSKAYRGGGHFTYREASLMFGYYDTEQLLGESLRIIEGTKVHAHDLPRNIGSTKGRRKPAAGNVARGDEPGPVASSPEALDIVGPGAARLIRGVVELSHSLAEGDGGGRGGGEAEIDRLFAASCEAVTAIPPGRARVLEDVFGGSLERSGEAAIIVDQWSQGGGSD